MDISFVRKMFMLDQRIEKLLSLGGGGGRGGSGSVGGGGQARTGPRETTAEEPGSRL